jgi:hypothetical protein
MIKTAFHVTELGNVILGDEIRPMRMMNVFLFDDRKSAELYCERMKGWYKKGTKILEVQYNTKDVERTWRPAYVDRGKVIKLKVGMTAKIVVKG